jgi:hypothetical protein
MKIRDMAKKFIVLRGTMSPKAQQRSLAKAEQMLAEIPLNEEREACRSEKPNKPMMQNNTQKHYFT